MLITVFTVLIAGSIQNVLAENIGDMFKPAPIIPVTTNGNSESGFSPQSADMIFTVKTPSVTAGGSVEPFIP